MGIINSDDSEAIANSVLDGSYFDNPPASTPAPAPKKSRYDDLIEASAAKHNVDPDLIRAQMGQESGFKIRALSNKGASGLMQLMPDTARSLGVKNIYDPAENIDAGTKYLRQQLDKFGSVPLALAAYNAGPGAVSKYGNKIPPYKETQNYVKRITSNYQGDGNHPSNIDTDAIASQYLGGGEEPVDSESIANSFLGDKKPTNEQEAVPSHLNPTAGGPVPETQATLDAQRRAAADPASSRVATLYTGAATSAPDENEIDIPIPNGQTLRADIGKLMQYVQQTGTNLADIRSGKADFTPLIGGKAQPTGEPFGARGPIAVMSLDKNGNELVSSTVSDPTAAPVEAALQKKQFPNQEITTKVVPSEDVINHRVAKHEEQAAQNAAADPNQPLIDEANAYQRSQGLPEITPAEFYARQQGGSVDTKASVNAPQDNTLIDPRQSWEDGQKKPLTDADVLKGAASSTAVDIKAAPKGVDINDYALRQAMRPVAQKYGIDNATLDSFIKSKHGYTDITPEEEAYFRKTGEKPNINVTNDVVNQLLNFRDGTTGLHKDLATDVQMKSAQEYQNRDENAGAPETAFNKDQVPTLGEVGEQLFGQRDANNNLTDARQAELAYRQGSDADTPLNERIAGSVKNAILSMQPFESAEAAGVARAVGGFVSSSAQFLAGADDLTGAAGKDVKAIVNPFGSVIGAVTDHLYGHSPGDLLGKFGNRVEAVSRLSTPDQGVYKITGEVGEMIGKLPVYAVVGVASGGNPVVTFGLTDALIAKGKGGGVGDVTKAGLTGAALGAVLGGVSRFGKMAADGLLETLIERPIPNIGWPKNVDPAARRAINRIWQADDILNSPSVGEGEAASARRLIDAELKKSGLSLDDIIAAKPGSVTGKEATTAAKELAEKLASKADDVTDTVDKITGRYVARQVIEKGVPVGIASSVGYGVAAAEGADQTERVKSALLFGAMELFGSFFHKGKGEKLTPEEINKVDGTVIKVPDESGKPHDLMMLKNGRGELEATDVTGQVPPEAVQGIVLPKPPKAPKGGGTEKPASLLDSTKITPEDIEAAKTPNETTPEVLPQSASLDQSVNVPDAEKPAPAAKVDKNSAPATDKAATTDSPSAIAAEVPEKDANAAESVTDKPAAETNAVEPTKSRPEMQVQGIRLAPKVGDRSAKAENLDTSGPTSKEKPEKVTGGTKDPWQMTGDEWQKARDDVRPNTAQSNATKASGSEAIARAGKLEHLLGDARKADQELVARYFDDQKAGRESTISDAEARDAIERINEPIRHKDVVRAAIEAGKNVPAEVLAEYPDLQLNKELQQTPASEAKPAADEGLQSNKRQSVTAHKMGDFHEFFGEDAKVVAKALDLTLTQRTLPNGEKESMTGVPYHAFEQSRKALAEQGIDISDAESSKPLTKKEKFEATKAARIVGGGEITRELQQRDEALRKSETDPLTGLANRSALDKALPKAEADPETSVIAFDANNFGQINKKVSQEAGDKALKDIADAITQAAQENGVTRLFRRGGDEMVVLAPKDVANKIRKRAEEIYGETDYKGVKVSLTGTVGNTFNEADSTLQAAKAERKAQGLSKKEKFEAAKKKAYKPRYDAEKTALMLGGAKSDIAASEKELAKYDPTAPAGRSNIARIKKEIEVRKRDLKGYEKDAAFHAEQPKTVADVVALPESQQVSPDADPTAQEAKASVKTEKVSYRTGLTPTQTEYLATSLAEAVDKAIAKSSGHKSAKEFAAAWDKDSSIKEGVPMSQVGDLELDMHDYIDVPGDGSFKIKTVFAANRLHQKITGKPIEGLRRDVGATIPRNNLDKWNAESKKASLNKASKETLAKIDSEQDRFERAYQRGDSPDLFADGEWQGYSAPLATVNQWREEAQKATDDKLLTQFEKLKDTNWKDQDSARFEVLRDELKDRDILPIMDEAEPVVESDNLHGRQPLSVIEQDILTAVGRREALPEGSEDAVTSLKNQKLLKDNGDLTMDGFKIAVHFINGEALPDDLQALITPAAPEPKATASVPEKASPAEALKSVLPTNEDPLSGIVDAKGNTDLEVVRVKRLPKPLYGKALLPESVSNRVSVNSKNLTNILESPSLRNKSLGEFNIPSQRAVVSHVIRAIRDLKVRDAVVKLVPVNVVDNLMSVQSPTQVSFHDETVLINTIAIDANHKVSLPIGSMDRLIRATALVRTERLSRNANQRRATDKRDVALQTFNDDGPTQSLSRASRTAKSPGQSVITGAGKLDSTLETSKINDGHDTDLQKQSIVSKGGSEVESDSPTSSILSQIYNRENSYDATKLQDVAGRVERGELEINRLDRQAERGRIAGGRRNVEASIILAADERSGQASGAGDGSRMDSHADTVRRQERVLENYAKQNDIWFKQDHFPERLYIGKGGEARVYQKDATHVVKLVDPRQIDKSLTPQRFLDNRIALFNHLFPEAHYELMGFMRDGDGKFRFVLTQPFIQGSEIKSQADVDAAMRTAGMERTERESYANSLYRVDDMHVGNVLKDAEGNIFVIDAVPRMADESMYQPFSVTEPEAPLKSVLPTDQTETPEFVKWFGDSKVVDENGQPLRVYRGRIRDKETLDPNDEGGIFFSPDTDIASDYTGTIDGGNVVPAYLSLQNPKVVTDSGETYTHNHANTIAQAKREGYDGVILKGFRDLIGNRRQTQYVAFGSTQIKSAIGNNGNFDPSDPSILKSIPDERMTVEEMRDLAFKPIDDILEIAEVSVSGDLVKMNAASQELYRRAFEESRIIEARTQGKTLRPSDYEDIFTGTFLKPEVVQNTIAVLHDKAIEAKEFGYSPEKVAVFNDHADALAEAAEAGHGTAVMFVLDKSLPHERFHQADYLGAAEKTLLNRHTDEYKQKLDKSWVRQILWKKHYSKYNEYTRIKSEKVLNATLRAEIPAYLLESSESDLKALGISPEMAASYMLDWFQGYADKNGIDSLDHFEKEELDVQTFINQVKEVYAQGNAVADGSTRPPNEAGPKIEPDSGGKDTGDAKRDGGGESKPVDYTAETYSGRRIEKREFERDMGLADDTRLRSLPLTLRRAGIDAIDDIYAVYKDVAAVEDATALLEQHGIEGSINLLRNLPAKALDVQHGILAGMVIKTLQNHAAQVRETQPDVAAKNFQTSLELAREWAVMATGAGRFTRTPSIIGPSVETLKYAIQGIIDAQDAGQQKTLSPEDWERIEGIGRELESALTKIETLRRENRNKQAQIKRLQDEKAGKRRRRTASGNANRQKLVDLITEDKARMSAVEDSKAKLLAKFKGSVEALKSVLGDDGDHYLDENGEPRTFYHSSPTKGLTELKASTAPQWGKGVYFASTRDGVLEGTHHIYEAQLPRELAEHDAFWKAVQQVENETDGDYYEPDFQIQKVTNLLKEQGYKGIIMPNEMYGGSEAVVFDGKDAKLTTPDATPLKSVLPADENEPLDPDTLNDFANVGAMLLTEGIASPEDYLPSDFRAEMTATFGDGITPYFDEIYKAAWDRRADWIADERFKATKQRVENKAGKELEDWEIAEIVEKDKAAAKRRRFIERYHEMTAGAKKPKRDITAYRSIIADLTKDKSDAVALGALVQAEGLGVADIHKRFSDAGITDEKEQRQALREGAKVWEQAKEQHKIDQDAIANEILEREKEQKSIDQVAWESRNELKKAQQAVADEMRRIKNGEMKYIAGRAWEYTSIPRTLMASFDVSGVGRQGGYLAIGDLGGSIFDIMRNIATGKKGRIGVVDQADNLSKMLKSFGEKGYGSVIQGIEKSPMFSLSQRAGVDYAAAGDANEGSLKGEELFKGDRAIESVPILGPVVMKGIVGWSERTYTSFLDAQRYQTFETLAQELMSHGLTFRSNPAQFKKIADFINIATGRGVIPSNKFGKVLMELPLFAPRYTLSRLQLINMTLNPVAYWNMPAYTRRIVARSAIRFYGTTMAVLGLVTLLGAAIGASVDWDPDSSDFLKIKIGSSKFDLFAGNLQPAKFLIKIVNSAIRTKGGMSNRLPGEFGNDVWSATTRFGRGKLSPGASLAVDYALGSDYVGNEFTWQKALMSRMIPLTIADTYDVYKLDGGGGVARNLVPMAIGIGVSTYKDRAERPHTEAEKFAAKAVSGRMSLKPQNADERAKQTAVQDLTAMSRNGVDITAELKDAVAKYGLSDQQVRNITGASGKSYLVDKAEGLGLDDFETVYDLATPAEKEQLLPLLDKKMKNAEKEGKLSPEQRERLNNKGAKIPGYVEMPENVKQEFDSLNIKTPDVGEKMTLRKGDKVALSDEQYDKYRREALERIYAAAGRLIESDSYQQSDETKRKFLLQKTIATQRRMEMEQTKGDLRRAVKAQ